MYFDQKCKELCQYCRDNDQPRFRADTKEWVHDVSIAIPGSAIGKRMGHAFCTASDFRREYASKLSVENT